MTRSTRPENHPERSTCLDFVAGLEPSHAVTLATLADEVQPAITIYESARTANELAATAVDQATEQTATASTTFGAAFVTWTVAIDRANVKGFAAVALKPEIGHQAVWSFLRNGGRAKVDRMTTLLVHVEKTPSLAGDAESLGALIAATTALQGAVAASEAAKRAWTTTSEALETASAAFDRAYGRLVKDLLRYDPEGGATSIPTFQREPAQVG